MPTPDKVARFYQSTKWRKVRKLIKIERMGICEECGGPGDEVHHKIPLSLQNIDNDSIAIDGSNLQLLCTSCHNAKRSEGIIRNDVEFNSNGDLVARKQVKHSHKYINECD